MPAHVSKRGAVGRASITIIWISLVLYGSSAAQEPPLKAADQTRSQIAALAERLATLLHSANKRRPFVVALTLPGDRQCPLGNWLADKISESLSSSHPELEVIPRSRWDFDGAASETSHDINQENAAKARYVKSLGAEVLVQGNFAAIPNGVGVTLLADDRFMGGESRFEALGEVSLNNEMKDLLALPLPQRTLLDGSYPAGTAGIGSPVCEQCPPPQYSYVARARGLAGVVILQVVVGSEGKTEKISVLRTPDPALASAAKRSVRTWQFKPASNAQGEFVPVILNVAVSFVLDAKLMQHHTME